MKKVLFIDRDGTLIREPDDFCVDSFEKLRLLPGVITYLGRIASETDYELVMVSNQDGLGTDSFPAEIFYPVHDFLVRTLENEGITFSEVCIDCSFENENRPTRKPGTGMLTRYLGDGYDLANSFVIGDRATDIELAGNLGAKAIFIKNLNFGPPEGEQIIALLARDWREIYEFLRLPPRKASRTRRTSETDVFVELNLDGCGNSNIQTGISFFNHMLEQLARHASLDLTINANGDLHVDQDHTIEDVAIVLGEAFSLALADKRGLERYGFTL